MWKILTKIDNKLGFTFCFGVHELLQLYLTQLRFVFANYGIFMQTIQLKILCRQSSQFGLKFDIHK